MRGGKSPSAELLDDSFQVVHLVQITGYECELFGCQFVRLGVTSIITISTPAVTEES